MGAAGGRADRADTLRIAGGALVAPDLICAEIGNAAWKRAVHDELPQAVAIEAVETAVGIFTLLVPITQLVTRATELAVQLRYPICDCFYLALTARDRAPLVTPDERLITAARQMKGVDAQPL